MALVRSGHAVLVVASLAALRWCLASRPDLIIIAVPSIDKQIETDLRLTIASSPGSVVIVLSTSWQIPQSTERRLFRMGVAEVQGRPADLNRLVALVERELIFRDEEIESRSSYARFRLQGSR
jgi:hypothetical protein